MIYSKNVTYRCTALVVLSIVSILASFAVAASNDIMEILPSDCQGCVRINNLQATLTQTDQYLAGASPVSLSMLVTMQLGKMFGDPLLTGIDMNGTFVFAALDAASEQEEKKTIFFFLVPSTGIPGFLKGNPNLSAPDADGIYVLQTPESQGNGRLTILPLTESNYLLIREGLDKSDVLAARKILNAKKSSLKTSLPADICKTAAQNPVWVYLDAGKLYQCYSKEIAEGLNEIQKQVAEQAKQKEPAAAEMVTKSLDIVTYFAQQTGWITVSLNPTPQQLQIEKTVYAKPGSELAGMLKPRAAAGKDWRYAGAMDNAAAVKLLMRFNKPLWEKLNNRMIDILYKDATEADKAAMEKMKSLVSKMMAAMGDEAAVSFSYRAGTPPFEFREIVAVNDAKTLLELQKESMELVGNLYQKMGMPITFTYAPSVEKYNGIDIGLYQVKFTSKDPNDETMKAVEMMYGKQGLQYPIAVTADKFLMAMGPDAMAQLKAMIGAKQTAAASDDLKMAFAAIPDNTRAEMIVSINLLRLIKGASEMGQQITAQQGMTMPDFWKGIDIGTTTSCMATAVFIENGNVRCRAVLPKEHLAETAKVLMQVQQQQMNYYMQQSQNKQDSDANSVPSPKKIAP